jgi:hypothetical protein
MLTRKASARRAEVSYGLLGAALAMGLGVAGGLSRRSARHAAQAGFIGLFVGGGAGALAAAALVPYYYRALQAATEEAAANDITRALMVHAGIWAALGLAAGAALGLGVGGRGRAANGAAGGALGGLLASVVYEVGGAYAFRFESTGLPVAEIPALRILAHIVTALAIAALAIRAITPNERRSPRAQRPS